MKVIRAAEMGMCFGVRDALQVVGRIADPTQVTIHGELVHNPVVMRSLQQAGFQQVTEAERGRRTPTPLVLITAHGISNRARLRLQNEGKGLIDTTCPLVRRVHQAAMELQAEGRHILLIGKLGHVEVQGIVEDLTDYDVLADADQVRCYESLRLGVLCQTTMPTKVVTEIYAQIRVQNPLADIRLIDTVCHPTKHRQTALLELLERVQAVVVVGGKNSNNTRRLVELCQENQTLAWHIASAAELRSEWFRGIQTVGLTAGTSTLDETIDAVHRALERMDTGVELESRVGQ